MDIDMEEDSIYLQKIDSIIDTWKDRNLEETIRSDFDQLRHKVRQRIDTLVNLLRKYEQFYLNQINNIENEYKSKYTNLKNDVEKLSNIKKEMRKDNHQRASVSKPTSIYVHNPFIDNLSERIRVFSQNKIDFIFNNKSTLPNGFIGKFSNTINKFDDKRMNQISELLMMNISGGDTQSGEQTAITPKINTNLLFLKPQILCRSNCRFTGAVLIPESKYNRLANNCFDVEFALFSVSNRNCLKLISFPDGRVLRTYNRFPFTNYNTKPDESLKEPRGMCWNHDKTLIVLCDSGNNRLIILKPIFKMSSHYFNLDIEYVSEIKQLTSLRDVNNRLGSILISQNQFQYPASVCCNSTNNGEIYVSDTLNSRIICINKEINGIENILNDGFNNPFSICCWNDKLIVADTYNNRILVMSTLDYHREFIIPVNKGEEREKSNNSDDENDDDNDLIGYHVVKKKRVSSSSSSSTSSNTDSSDNDDDDDDKCSSSSDASTNTIISNTNAKALLKLRNGYFKRPYGVYVDCNNRLYVLDWFRTDTNSSEEVIKLSGRIQSFDLDNDYQMLNYSYGSHYLHLPNTLISLKSGSFVVCNVRHLTMFSTNRTKKRRHHKLKFNNVRIYSEDDDDFK